MKIVSISIISNLLVFGLLVGSVRFLPGLFHTSASTVAKTEGIILVFLGLLSLAILVLFMNSAHHSLADGVILYPAAFGAFVLLPCGTIALGYAYWALWGPAFIAFMTSPRASLPLWAKGALILICAELLVEFVLRAAVYAGFAGAYMKSNGFPLGTTVVLTWQSGIQALGGLWQLVYFAVAAVGIGIFYRGYASGFPVFLVGVLFWWVSTLKAGLTIPFPIDLNDMAKAYRMVLLRNALWAGGVVVQALGVAVGWNFRG